MQRGEMGQILAHLASALLLGAVLTTGARAMEWRLSLRTAQVALEQKNLSLAETTLQEAITKVDSLGAEHLPLLDELQVLGAFLVQQGERERGRELIRRSLDLAIRAVGSEAPSLEPFHSLMGILDLQDGDAFAAVDHLRFSYRVLAGNVSVGNRAFQEVLQSYVEALRQTGDSREFLSVFSRYGHLVDLGPLQERPAAPPVEEEVERGEEAEVRSLVPKDAAPSEPEPVASERVVPEPVATESVAPEARSLPPPVLAKAIHMVEERLDRLGKGMDQMRSQRNWTRSQIRLLRGRRRFQRQTLVETYQEAVVRGRELALLATATGVIRRSVESVAVPEIQQVLERRMGEVERYERQVSEMVSLLRKLFGVLHRNDPTVIADPSLLGGPRGAL